LAASRPDPFLALGGDWAAATVSVFVLLLSLLLLLALLVVLVVMSATLVSVPELIFFVLADLSFVGNEECVVAELESCRLAGTIASFWGVALEVIFAGELMSPPLPVLLLLKL
jgi:hypothetical protein